MAFIKNLLGNKTRSTKEATQVIPQRTVFEEIKDRSPEEIFQEVWDQKIQWTFDSSDDPWHSQPIPCAYSDEECLLIEYKYMNEQKKSKTFYEKSKLKQESFIQETNQVNGELSRQVYMDNFYSINFTNMIQFHVIQTNRQRPVARGIGSYKKDEFDNSNTLGSTQDIYLTIRMRSSRSDRYCSQKNFKLFSELFSDKKIPINEIQGWIQWQWYSRNNNQWPSLSQIKSGIIKSVHQRVNNNYLALKNQMKNQADADKHNIEAYQKTIMDDYEEIWKLIFQTACAKLQISEDEPLDMYFLERNPDHPVAKLLVKIYSMEVKYINDILDANINQNQDFIDSLGPFAFAIGNILQQGEKFKKDFSNKCFTAWRGVILEKDHFDKFKDEMQKNTDQKTGEIKVQIFLHLIGHTSLSANYEFSISQLRQAWTKTKPTVRQKSIAVLFDIKIDPLSNSFFKMDSQNNDYSLYSEEKEVIMPEGARLCFKMIGDSKHEDFKFVLVNTIAS